MEKKSILFIKFTVNYYKIQFFIKIIHSFLFNNVSVY